MRTIRTSVFETNSSTTHCVTFSSQYKKVDEIPMRDKSEFPLPDKNGVLEIEIDCYWDNDITEDSRFDMENVTTFIKYLAGHAVFSSTKRIWNSRKNTEYENNFDENKELFLKDLQEAYTIMGLTPPKDVKYFFLDVNDNKHYITKENLYHWFEPFEGSWYEKKSDWKKYIARQIKENPDAANWPYTKYRIGMTGNDLCGSSYKDVTDYYECTSNLNRYWTSSGNEEGDFEEKELTTVEILTRKIGLDFYHT